MGRFGWDHGADFDQARTMFASEMAVARGEVGHLATGYDPTHRLGSWAILLIQLVNGSRISEGRDAFVEWKRTGAREVEVRVRKLSPLLVCAICRSQYSKKAKKNGLQAHQQSTGHKGSSEIPSQETRMMTIPPEIQDSDRGKAYAVTYYAVKKFSERRAGWNTHSYRYAQITKLSSLGTPAQLIAKVSHHKKIDFIVDYTAQRAADRTLRELTAALSSNHEVRKAKLQELEKTRRKLLGIT